MKTQIDPTKYTAHKYFGKFEGESAATEYFYEQILNRDGEAFYSPAMPIYLDEPDTPSATIFHVNADEAEAFDLPIGSTFMIREDLRGFVYGSVHATRDEAEAKFRAWLAL